MSHIRLIALCFLDDHTPRVFKPGGARGNPVLGRHEFFTEDLWITFDCSR
jgi:hypothetical protein